MQHFTRDNTEYQGDSDKKRLSIGCGVRRLVGMCGHSQVRIIEEKGILTLYTVLFVIVHEKHEKYEKVLVEVNKLTITSDNKHFESLCPYGVDDFVIAVFKESFC
jgi:hypothetical protein